MGLGQSGATGHRAVSHVVEGYRFEPECAAILLVLQRETTAQEIVHNKGTVARPNAQVTTFRKFLFWVRSYLGKQTYQTTCIN